MSHPVLVRAYAPPTHSGSDAGSKAGSVGRALPPVSAYAFTDILRAANSVELQRAVDGIAHIYAHNRLSLADEYASHLPPLGEITADDSANVRPHLLRPGGIRPALTSVPEGSSGGSKASHTSAGSGGKGKGRRKSAAQKLLALAWPVARAPGPLLPDNGGLTAASAGTTACVVTTTTGRARIGHIGCTVPVTTTTALATEPDMCWSYIAQGDHAHLSSQGSARLSLQRLLAAECDRGTPG